MRSDYSFPRLSFLLRALHCLLFRTYHLDGVHGVTVGSGRGQQAVVVSVLAVHLQISRANLPALPAAPGEPFRLRRDEALSRLSRMLTVRPSVSLPLTPHDA